MQISRRRRRREEHLSRYLPKYSRTSLEGFNIYMATSMKWLILERLFVHCARACCEEDSDNEYAQTTTSSSYR